MKFRDSYQLPKQRNRDASQVRVPFEQAFIDDFCRRHHIAWLAFFGSVTRDDFTEQSDVDVLVDFEEGHVPGLIAFNMWEEELSTYFKRKVDLRTAFELHPRFRGDVLREAVYVFEGVRSQDDALTA